jgi:two-component system cell cycle sensor histidine kinase/response regulator CckA
MGPRPETILVVEDDEAVRQFTLMVLRHHGYHTLEAFDGQTGLAAYQRHREDIDLVLTDVVMPHSGADMAERILDSVPSARIVFMSGTAGIGDFPADLKRFPMLHKPFTSVALLDTVRHALM